VGRNGRPESQSAGDEPRDARDRVDTQKKTPVARKRDLRRVQERREEFIASQAKLDVKRLIFVDESGYRLGSSPRFGWAPRGDDAPGKAVHGAWQTITMIGALALDGFRGFMTVDAGTGAEVFLAFVQEELVSNLRPGDLVVMDNLSAHKIADVRTAIQSAGADVLFLPPYSPEFNPIERAWAKLKDFVRRLSTLTRDEFDRALASAMRAISSDDIRGWTAFAGYDLRST
jgi:transposase